MRLSDTAQEFNGQRYYLCGRYFSRAKRGGGREYLHRAVWEYHNGTIPVGHHVHHKDNDRSNNTVGNLETFSPSDHLSSCHGEQCAENLASGMVAGIEAAKAWHASDDGIEWHRQHAAAQKHLHTERVIDKVCEYCSRPFKAPRLHRSRARFCSNVCKSAHRRASGVDDIEKLCAVCGASFTSNKYQKTRTCSRPCSGRLGISKRYGRPVSVPGA
jgi:hypothetical protein